MIDQDRISLYDSVTTEMPAVIFNFADIKEVILVKEDSEMTHSIDAFDFGDPSKIGVVFHLKLKNERGGLIIEPDAANVQKWDYVFFVMNLILSQQIVQSLSFKPLTTEANQAKMFKGLNMKTLDNVNLKRQMAFEYNFPVDDSKMHDDVEDRLIDWQILDRCAAMHHDNLYKKIGDRAKKDGIEEGNNKATQTEAILAAANIKDETCDITDITTVVDQYAKDARKGVRDFNYAIPALSSFVAGQGLGGRKSLGNVLVSNEQANRNELLEPQIGEADDKIPSPQVELDLSIESIEQEEPDPNYEDPTKDKSESKFILNKNQRQLKKLSLRMRTE